MRSSLEDKKFMARAFQLAKLGKNKVAPNPMVGAVLVKNGKIIVESWYKKFGGSHAEKLILQTAQKKKINLHDAIFYINLEPCVDFKTKKTPACTPEIIKTKPQRVVIAIKDPNPAVNGRGIKALQKAGIKVDIGCLANQAKKLNEKFIKRASTGRPFVALKAAMSLDGKIATRTGNSKWISCAKSRKLVNKIRDEYDAILVGINTVEIDDPMLSGTKRNPKRIVLDSTLRINICSKFLRDNNVLIVTTKRAPKPKVDFLKKRGYDIKIFPQKISISPLLRFLTQKKINSVLVEGGAEIFGSFIDTKCADRLYWFISPKIIGGQNAKTAVAGKGISKIAQAIQLKKITTTKIGKDILIEGELS